KIVALKVTGNKQVAAINVKGSETVKGICIFTTGNQSEVIVNIHVKVQSLLYIGRGNKARTIVTVNKPGQIQTLYGDISGNLGKLTIQGEGSYPCEKVRLRGNGPVFSCRTGTGI